MLLFFVGHMAHFAPNARSESLFCKMKTAKHCNRLLDCDLVSTVAIYY